MLANGEMIDIMEEEYSSVYKEISFTRDHFLKEKEMALGFGKTSKDKCTSDIGRTTKSKEKDTTMIRSLNSNTQGHGMKI